MSTHVRSFISISMKAAIENKSCGKCKISSTFLFPFSKIMFIISIGIHKMLVNIANMEDPDQTASSEAV